MLRVILCAALLGMPVAGAAQDIRFGDDSGEYANDGECDDPRFRGSGMASGLSKNNRLGDATDCRNAYDDGRIELWDEAKARAATVCSEIRFGDNSSRWAKDDECDDYRFVGQRMSSVVLSEDIGHDARDCRALCEAGEIFLRDY